jgi:hypothetical protein
MFLSIQQSISCFLKVTPRRTVVAEEHLLEAIDENSQDCIVSNMGLHWVNDLPGAYGTLFVLATSPIGYLMSCVFHRRFEADSTSSQARWRLYGIHDWRRFVV